MLPTKKKKSTITSTISINLQNERPELSNERSQKQILNGPAHILVNKFVRHPQGPNNKLRKANYPIFKVRNLIQHAYTKNISWHDHFLGRLLEFNHILNYIGKVINFLIQK